MSRGAREGTSRHGRRLRGRAVVAAAAASALALVASCSLGLDESLLDRPPDASIGDATLPPLGDGAVEGGIPGVGDAAACENDDGCKTTHGCLKGKCDLARKTCVYDVCRANACSAAACDPAQATCGTATTYKYRATQFSVGQQLACGGCAVAVYPWLFLLTPTGAVAFNVANVASASPPQVPIVGLGFVPGQIALSGNRVWFLGGASGPGPSRVPLAYVDVPADPFATKLVATSALASSPRPAEGMTLLPLFPLQGGAALLVGPGAEQHPSAIAPAPLVEPVTLAPTALQFTAGTGPVTTSGSRLLMYGIIEQTANAYFIEGAGTNAPQTGPVTSLPEIGAASTSRRFARSVDGAVFLATGVHQGAGDTLSTRAVRGHFLVADANAPIDAKVGVDIEVYDVPAVPIGPNGGVVGHVAMLDAKTALVSVLAKDNGAQTAVEFVTREPLGLLKGPDGTVQRHVLPIPVTDLVAATGSNGIGYLVANDQPGPPASATVYVFDPACPR